MKRLNVKSCAPWWTHITLKKYFLIPSGTLFWVNFLLCLLGLGGLGALAYFGGFIFRDISYKGVPILTLRAPSDAYFVKSGDKIAAKLEDYTYEEPISNKFTIAKRTKTTYQSLKYCASSTCASGCLAYYRTNLIPNWCPVDSFTQDLEFSNVGSTSIKLQIMFEGGAPKALQEKGAETQDMTVTQILSALSNQNKKGNILKVGLFYELKCEFGSCTVAEKVSKMDKQNESNLTRYQYVDTSNRFEIDLYGYFFTFEANATYRQFQYASIVILLGSYYLLVELITNFTTICYFKCKKIRG